MIGNKHLDRVMEIDIVQQFMCKHHMVGKMCRDIFILYRLPYVVGMIDFAIENYLVFFFSNLDENLLLEGSSALGCSLDMGLQNLKVLRGQNYEKHPLLNIFLSESVNKMGDLYSDLDALDKLLPLIETRGGLKSFKDGTFDSRFDFANSVKPMYPGLKERYLKCISEKQSLS